QFVFERHQVGEKMEGVVTVGLLLGSVPLEKLLPYRPHLRLVHRRGPSQGSVRSVRLKHAIRLKADPNGSVGSTSYHRFVSQLIGKLTAIDRSADNREAPYRRSRRNRSTDPGPIPVTVEREGER